MLGFYEKRKLKTLLYSRAILVLMLLLVGGMAYAAHGAYKKERETNERRMELAAQLAALEERAAELEHDIVTLEDPRGIEAELRRRYEVGFEGEEAIVFVEEKGGYIEDEEGPEEPQGVLHKLKEIF